MLPIQEGDGSEICPVQDSSMAITHVDSFALDITLDSPNASHKSDKMEFSISRISSGGMLNPSATSNRKLVWIKQNSRFATLYEGTRSRGRRHDSQLLINRHR